MGIICGLIPCNSGSFESISHLSTAHIGIPAQNLNDFSEPFSMVLPCGLFTDFSEWCFFRSIPNLEWFPFKTIEFSGITMHLTLQKLRIAFPNSTILSIFQKLDFLIWIDLPGISFKSGFFPRPLNHRKKFGSDSFSSRDLPLLEICLELELMDFSSGYHSGKKS